MYAHDPRTHHTTPMLIHVNTNTLYYPTHIIYMLRNSQHTHTHLCVCERAYKISHKLMKQREKWRVKELTQWGDLRRADGGFGEGGGGREGCRRLEDLTGKDAGLFALADGDPRRGGKVPW